MNVSGLTLAVGEKPSLSRYIFKGLSGNMDVKKPSNWIPKYDDPDGMGSARDQQNERMRRFTEAPDDRFVCNQCGHRFDHVDFCEELRLCIKCAFDTQNPLAKGE